MGLNMKENETMTVYVATILDGDKYHKAGEEFDVCKWQLDDVKENGLRLPIEDNEFRKDYHFYHWYPVSICKKTYRLDLIEMESIPGGDRKNNPYEPIIKVDYVDVTDRDWKERWP